MEKEAQKQMRITILKTQILISNPSHKIPGHELNNEMIFLNREH